ncbi:FAD-binding and (Fe-S)-binding domain-containing protein [Agromyces sp. G08B096]|uniref:D-lactate dehydrogenase (cytochrome) n=1 Tax=Agromyces sp. G08B096 TaxID=3156399 RepID=A0AAU7W922_9MICO
MTAAASLVADLRAVLPEARVSTRAIDRHALAHDASHYLLVPEAVAVAEDAADVARVLAAATRHRVPVTFRSGGTSLSGQASAPGLLLDTRRGFRRTEVLDGGARVRVEPGVTLRSANARLARHGRALGPDPASEVACTVGGVIANNSSGMAAGVELNSYRTLESLVAVLPSGTVVDSAAPDAADRLRRDEPELVAALTALRDRVRADPASVAEIRERFAMKNTMGYALNAFLDFDDPLDLLVHLLVGSEGTLAFVADAVFRTVAVDPHVATGLLIFESVDAAAAALPALVATGAAALELMDATSLRVARRDPAAPAAVQGFDLAEHAALLVEYRGATPEALASRMAAAQTVLDGLPLVRAAELSADPATRAALWHVRKGLYATVAGARPSGTTALLEDVAVPVSRLADACRDLRALCERFAYPDSVIFGHAKDGNLHFMVTDDFDAPGARDRLRAFTEALVDLVLGHGGNLKAEHGTGRAMAPFVPRQYRAELVEVMRELKRAFDPAGVLNPGVILTDDHDAHLRDLKPVVSVEAEVDRCVECGYCEPVCPSRDLTLTPRQRIVVRRSRALAEAAGDARLVAELDQAYEYDGVQTCAVDGMCQTACPVRINTGDLVKRLRAEGRSALEQRTWATAARHWGAVTGAAGVALDVAAAVPTPLVQLPNRAARAVLGSDTVPLYTGDLPAGGRARSRVAHAERTSGAGASRPSAPVAVFLPSCQGAMFAPGDPSGPGVQAALERLAGLAGLALVVPDGVDGLCCGTPWSSKGFGAGHREMADRVLDAVWSASDGGRLPVVVDASSCTEGVARIMRLAREAGDPRAVEVVDAVAFTAEHVLPALPGLDASARIDRVVLHPTCSSAQLGIDADLRRLASAIADDVQVPVAWNCCGFAGDRGMLHPELTAAATAAEAAEVQGLDGDAHASCNRACEIAMTRATGRTYRHLLELVAERYAVTA